MSASIPSEFDTEELVKLLHKKFGFAYDRVKRGRESYVSSWCFITNSDSGCPLRSPDRRKKTGCSEWRKLRKYMVFEMKRVQEIGMR